MKMFNVALAGCGRVAGLYDTRGNESVLSHAAGIFSHKELELKAVCDNDASHLASFRSQWNVPLAYDSFRRMVADLTPHLLCIATPTAMHYEHLRHALRCNIPLIFVEKPLCETIHQSREIMRLYAGSTSKVLVNYMRRFNPALKRIREELLNGQHGPVVRAHVYYNKGLLHNGSHLIDLVQWVIGPVTDIDHITYHRPVLEDDMDVDLQLRINSRIPVSMEVFPFEHYNLLEVDILTEKAMIRLLKGGREIHVCKGAQDTHFPHLKQLTRIEWPVENPWNTIYRYSYRHCVDILLGVSEPLATLEEASDLVELVSQIKRSRKKE
jgi:predicted dehydrogenase